MEEQAKKQDQVPWDIFVEEMLRGVCQRGRRLFVVGVVVYGGGTAAILSLVPNSALALALQMILFQMCVMYAAMMEMYPCIRGAFLTSLEGSNRSVPAMERMGEAADRLTAIAKKNEKDGDIVERFEKAGKRVVAEMKEGMKEGLKWDLPDPDAYDPLLDGPAPVAVTTEVDSLAVRQLEDEQRAMVGDDVIQPDTETRVFPAVSADVCKGNGNPPEIEGT